MNPTLPLTNGVTVDKPNFQGLSVLPKTEKVGLHISRGF